MRNKVLLPAAAFAALPALWAVLPSGELDPAPFEDAPAAARWVNQAGHTEPIQALAPLDKAGAAEDRVALAPGGVAAAGAPSLEPGEAPISALPTEFPLDELGPDLAARLNSRLALFDEPSDGMYASWYAGSSLEDLARTHFDGAIAVNALAALDWGRPNGRAAAEAFELGSIVSRQASFNKEVTWLNLEVNRRVEFSRGPVTIALASRSEDDLVRAYPGPADRYVLGMLLRREYNALVREAAQDEFAKVRAMSPAERSKHSAPFLT